MVSLRKCAGNIECATRMVKCLDVGCLTHMYMYLFGFRLAPARLYPLLYVYAYHTRLKRHAQYAWLMRYCISNYNRSTHGVTYVLRPRFAGSTLGILADVRFQYDHCMLW